jgi:hypothetical protein
VANLRRGEVELCIRKVAMRPSGASRRGIEGRGGAATRDCVCRSARAEPHDFFAARKRILFARESLAGEKKAAASVILRHGAEARLDFLRRALGRATLAAPDVEPAPKETRGAARCDLRSEDGAFEIGRAHV